MGNVKRVLQDRRKEGEDVQDEMDSCCKLRF